MVQFNKRILFFLIAAALMVIAPASPRASLAAEPKASGDTELAKQMEEIQDNLKKLRKTVKDPAANKDTLETLSKLQALTVSSKALVPAKAAGVAEGERAKFVAGYRKDMAALLEHLCKIETAVLDNDNAKADELFKQLKKIEDDGHEKYSDQ
jgi:soluble cytochrome b562